MSRRTPSPLAVASRPQRKPDSLRHARGRSLPLLFLVRATARDGWFGEDVPVSVAGRAESVPRRRIEWSSGRGRLPSALLLYGPPALPSAGRDGLPHGRNGWGRSVRTGSAAQAGE